jgi:hypothetical protein
LKKFTFATYYNGTIHESSLFVNFLIKSIFIRDKNETRTKVKKQGTVDMESGQIFRYSEEDKSYMALPN